MRVQDKHILVTGSRRGIGLSIATRLAAEGAVVVLADIEKEACDAAAADLVSQGFDARSYALDVSMEESWERLAASVQKDIGGLDGLVNNAGVELTTAVADTALADWQKVLDVNLTGVFLGTKHMAPLLQTRGGATAAGASVVNISSILGLVGFADASAYAASKGGVRLFTKSIAIEFANAGKNIRVNSVHPGFIRTRMTETGAERLAAGGLAEDVESVFRQLQEITPLGRIGAPNDIANGVLFLMSDESAFMTGAELVIDGGYTAR